MPEARPNSVSRVRLAVTPVGVICIALSLWGCLAIYNATYHLSPSYRFAGRQFVWLLIGAAALVAASGLDRRFYRRHILFIAAAAYLPLWLVLAYGIRINGMRGWFAYRGVFLQPSELAKPVFVLCLALVLHCTREHRGEWLRGYLPAVLLFVLWCIPIALEPDFGALLVYGLAFAGVYWCMDGRLTHLALSGLAAVPVFVLVLQRHRYVLARFAAFLNPEAHAQQAGWHLIQCRRALACGGLAGRSWGHGGWSQAYLPLGYSDSIFASVAEAVGFVGVLPIILCIFAWGVYGHAEVRKADDGFVQAVILGMVIMLAGQAFIHLSVNLGLVPPTGVTLPLISYGGSSLLATLAAVGIVESFARPEASPA